MINLLRSKAHQEQAGDKVAIPFGEHDDTCPIEALHKWLAKAKITEGAVFRGVDRYGHVAATGLHRDSIAAVFKTAAARAGMNATNIAGHNVRAGMATQAAFNGLFERAIARTTSHRSRRVLRRYILFAQMSRHARAISNEPINASRKICAGRICSSCKCPLPAPHSTGPKQCGLCADKRLVFMYFRQRYGWYCSFTTEARKKLPRELTFKTPD